MVCRISCDSFTLNIKDHHFLIQISKIHFKMYNILQEIRVSNFVRLDWRPFENKEKNEKNASFT